GHSAAAWPMDVSKTGLIVSASYDNTARVWKPDGTEIAVLHSQDGRFEDVSFSPDGKRIVTVGRDRIARIWDATESPNVSCGSTDVYDAAFSPDGRLIVTRCGDKTVRTWDATSGIELAVLRHADSVWSARFLPDSRRILTSSLDETARVWDATNGTELRP